MVQGGLPASDFDKIRINVMLLLQFLEICPHYFRQTRTKILDLDRIVQIMCDNRRFCIILIKNGL